MFPLRRGGAIDTAVARGVSQMEAKESSTQRLLEQIDGLRAQVSGQSPPILMRARYPQAGFGIETDSIGGLVLSGSIDREGDADYEPRCHDLCSGANAGWNWG